MKERERERERESVHKHFLCGVYIMTQVRTCLLEASESTNDGPQQGNALLGEPSAIWPTLSPLASFWLVTCPYTVTVMYCMLVSFQGGM